MRIPKPDRGLVNQIWQSRRESVAFKPAKHSRLETSATLSKASDRAFRTPKCPSTDTKSSIQTTRFVKFSKSSKASMNFHSPSTLGLQNPCAEFCRIRMRLAPRLRAPAARTLIAGLRVARAAAPIVFGTSQLAHAGLVQRVRVALGPRRRPHITEVITH